MKTSLLTGLVLCGMAACLNAEAQSEAQTPYFKATIYPIATTSKIHVVVSKEFGRKFYFCLRDGQHNLVYRDEMEKRATQHRFVLDLSKLANGKYYIDLLDGKTPVVTKTIVKEEIVLAKPIVTNQILCLK